MRWGLIPSWVKDTRGFPLLINARSEEAGYKLPVPHRDAPSARSGAGSVSREWKQSGTGKAGLPAAPARWRPCRFAALMEPYSSRADRRSMEPCSPHPPIRQLRIIHHRTPVVIGRRTLRWLD